MLAAQKVVGSIPRKHTLTKRNVYPECKSLASAKCMNVTDLDLMCDSQGDFKLMCDNAMVYNRPETVYYKAAKKLLHTGFKMMSKVTLLLQFAFLPGSSVTSFPFDSDACG